MAVTISYLKVTHQEVVVKFAGTGTSAAVNLTTNMIQSLAQATDGATQTVNIVGIGWTGLPSSTATVKRNSVNVISLDTSGGGYLDFDGQELPKDTTQNTQPIIVDISAAAEAQVWLKLRKESGYKTFIQPEQFGAYDDPTSASA
mgnify:CR=1 FL=1